MRPFKTGITLSNWLLRISVLLFVFTVYFDTFLDFNLKAITFYVSAIYVVFSVLLFVGGFLSKHSLTVLSGLLLMIVSIYVLISLYTKPIDSGEVMHFMILSMGLYFLSNGNKR